MTLVCGFSGVTSEQFRSIRKKVSLLGIKCKVGIAGGKVGFVSEALGKSVWDTLLIMLKKEEGIIPLYFLIGNREVSLEYGKISIKEGLGPLGYLQMNKPLKGVIRTLIIGRMLAPKIVRLKEDLK